MAGQLPAQGPHLDEYGRGKIVLGILIGGYRRVVLNNFWEISNNFRIFSLRTRPLVLNSFGKF
jgi:hypothetical protein